MKLLKTIPVASCVLAALVASPAHAEDVYKIGVSAGLTGYAAAVDRAWRDGLEVAAEYVNCDRRDHGSQGPGRSSKTTSPSRRKRSPSIAR